jgi:hypothetical protein
MQFRARKLAAVSSRGRTHIIRHTGLETFWLCSLCCHLPLPDVPVSLRCFSLAATQPCDDLLMPLASPRAAFSTSSSSPHPSRRTLGHPFRCFVWLCPCGGEIHACPCSVSAQHEIVVSGSATLPDMIAACSCVCVCVCVCLCVCVCVCVCVFGLDFQELVHGRRGRSEHFRCRVRA